MKSEGDMKISKSRGEPKTFVNDGRKLPKKLTKNRIRNIAEYYIQQRECTEQMLLSMLTRRLQKRLFVAGIDREGEKAEAEKEIVLEVKRLVDLGLIDDRRYCLIKARSGFRAGLGYKRIELELKRKGIKDGLIQSVMMELVEEGLFDAGSEKIETIRDLDERAAMVFAQRKRLGPWRRETASKATDEVKIWRKETGAMARAGFGIDLIKKILNL